MPPAASPNFADMRHGDARPARARHFRRAARARRPASCRAAGSGVRCPHSAATSDFATRLATCSTTSASATSRPRRPPGRLQGEAAGQIARRRSTCARPRAAGRSSSRASRAGCGGAARRAAPGGEQLESSSRCAARPPTPNASIRAAASSMASGMPSSLRQMSATSGASASPNENVGGRRRTLDEELDRRKAERLGGGRAGDAGGSRQRRQAMHLLALAPQRLAAGRQDLHLGAWS